MNLAAVQQEFLGHLLDQDRPLPPLWDRRMVAGLEVYRNAYRARLVDALREAFEQTVRLVGEDAFNAAAAHHLIMHPPGGWTLDLAGEGFAGTLEELFPDDPDVAELAWLEWAMHCAFVEADETPLDAPGFLAASADFTEDGWTGMTLCFVPSLRMRWVATDCASLWRDLKAGAAEMQVSPGEDHRLCIVWREGHLPVFRLLQRLEARSLAEMAAGSTFGNICENFAEDGDPAAAERAGKMLLEWLKNGLIASIDPPRSG